MPRVARLLVKDENSVYHIISRTALNGLPIKDYEKDYLVQIIQQYSRLFFIEVLGFCVMSSHFHLLVRTLPGDRFSDTEIRDRYISFFGDDIDFSEQMIPDLREKWSSLSGYIKEIKQTFSRFYNSLHKRRGYFWGDRFKSVIVENGETLVNCLAYIDLNPVRADIVKRPEDYRWSSIGYHAQTGNYGNFLSLDFGLKAFGKMSDKERFRKYRKFVYESGAIPHPEKPGAKTIDQKILKKEKKKNFKITTTDRFRNRTRHFTESSIIGSKTFVTKSYKRFQDLFYSTKEKVPNPIEGLTNIYSLKKLTE